MSERNSAQSRAACKPSTELDREPRPTQAVIGRSMVRRIYSPVFGTGKAKNSEIVERENSVNQRCKLALG
jgi:hypothetical protein